MAMRRLPSSETARRYDAVTAQIRRLRVRQAHVRQRWEALWQASEQTRQAPDAEIERALAQAARELDEGRATLKALEAAKGELAVQLAAKEGPKSEDI